MVLKRLRGVIENGILLSRLFAWIGVLLSSLLLLLLLLYYVIVLLLFLTNFMLLFYRLF